MPTYEYVCEKCGEHFEKSQSMNDKPLVTCPKEVCGQKKWGRGKVRKKISGGGGLIFKGSGFYTTDYRSDKYKEAAKKDSAASAPKESSGTKEATGPKPAETKPAAKESKKAKED
jgi:putative FmdB family regulatory protein